jgi:ribonuclease P protein subunit RPR2
MRFNKTREKKTQGGIALERIQILMQQAENEIAAGNEKQAKRNVTLAVKISTRTKTRIPQNLKDKYCKKCYIYLTPGRTSRTRLNTKHQRIEITCLACGTKKWLRIKSKATPKRDKPADAR